MPTCGSEAACDYQLLKALLPRCGCLGYLVVGLWWPGGCWFAWSPAAARDEPTAVTTFSIPTWVTLLLSSRCALPVQQLLGKPPSSPHWELNRVHPPCGYVCLESTRSTCPSCFCFSLLAEAICLVSCLSLLTSSLSSGRILVAAIARGKRRNEKLVCIAQKHADWIFGAIQFWNLFCGVWGALTCPSVIMEKISKAIVSTM